MNVTEQAKARGVRLAFCGLNADWCIDAWHVHSGATPNTQSGDLYLLQDDEGDHPYQLVVRTHTGTLTTPDGGNDIITEIVAGDLETVLTTIKETTQ